MTKNEKNRIKKIEGHEQKRAFKRRVRKTITHRNGVPLLTRKMLRELKAHTNPLEQLIIILKNVFPSLLTDLANLTDIRNQSYIEYSMQEITLIRLIALCCGIQSMKEIVTKLDKKVFISNINQILDTNLTDFPCDDTISNVINSIDILELDKLRTKLTKKLIESKTLDKFRLSNGSFYIVIDGSGLFSTRINLGKNCIYKVHNKDTENEYTEYQYYVLEAKLICNDYVFSFATEFVENEHMNNESEKQDCELKAAHRLLDKIRRAYPKLPITIGGDALYVNKPFMDACINHKMDYILRYKDSVMSTIMEEFNKVDKITHKDYEFINNIGFGSGTKQSEGITNIIKYTLRNDIGNKQNDSLVDLSYTKETNFMFIT
ncbi:MAG: transposase family protein, partial [Bacilli bacterium]|nr:transposase family protein [Bacilli bacterium]